MTYALIIRETDTVAAYGKMIIARKNTEALPDPKNLISSSQIHASGGEEGAVNGRCM